jgi:beta-glucosidase
MTDFGARHSLASKPPSLAAGLDQELNRWRFWTPGLIKDALAAGTITTAQVDRAAFRVVRSHIAAGLFDVALPAAPADVVSTPANVAVAREVAEKGAVLLKNDRVLPFGRSARRIAVIGPTASGEPTNGISAASVCGPTAPSVPCTPVPPLDAITARAAVSGGTVTFDAGTDVASAAATAAAADVAVVFGYYRSGEFGDRPNLSLDGGGDVLVAAVSAANPRTVVVLQTGGPVLMPWLDDVAGVLETWYAGQQMGPAIAALLWGDVAPSGRLTHTFPRSEADLPTASSPRRYPGTFADGSTTRPPGSTEIRQVEYGEGLQVGYRWYQAQGIAPLFPFGYGLTYTRFAYSDLHVTPVTDGRGKVRVRFTVRNVGPHAGAEVPQVYLTLPAAAGEPFKRLVGFDRVELAPGQARTVEVTLDPRSAARPLSFWDTGSGRWRTLRRTYTVHVGPSVATLPLRATVRVR